MLTKQEFEQIEMNAAMMRAMSATGHFNLNKQHTSLSSMHYSLGGGYFELVVFLDTEEQAQDAYRVISKHYMHDGDSLSIDELTTKECWTVSFQTVFGK